jgi:hypothetical protein
MYGWNLMGDARTGIGSSGAAVLLLGIAGTACSVVLWIAKIQPHSTLLDPLNLPADVASGWSGLAVIATVCGGLALVFGLIRGAISGRGATGLTILFAVLALSYPIAIIVGASTPKTPGPL